MEETKEKRGRGEGALRLRKDGRWEGTYTVGIDEATGKRIRKSVLAKTEEECEEKLQELIKEQNQIKADQAPKEEEEAPSGDTTLGEWMDKWYNLYCVPGIRESTAATYKRCIYQHVIPKIGDMPLGEITTSKLERYIAELMTNGKVKDDGKGMGLSSEVVRKTHALIQSALDRAVIDGLIERNPAKNCKLPKKKNKKVDILSKEEIKRLLIQAKEDGMLEMMLIDLSSGMRRGELLGLKWKDLNFKTRELHIKRSVVLIEGKINVTALKTKSSKRTIILPENVIQVLKRYKKEMPIESEWIFPSPIKENMPRDPSAVRKKFSRVLERAGCKHVRLHALRHTFATMALQYGLDIKTLSSTIGHASVDVTIDTYSHATEKTRFDAADKIDSFIGRSKGITRPRVLNKQPTEKFEAYKGKKRKPGTGYVKQISENCWQGRYTPTIDGKRISKNVYAPTEKECEKKLAELIAEMKAEIKASKQTSSMIMTL